MRWKRRFIAWILVLAMTMTSLGNTWLTGSAAENDADTGTAQSVTNSGEEDAAQADESAADGENADSEGSSNGEELSLLDVFSYENYGELTWAQAGRILSGLLGFIEEDGADVDLDQYTGRISSLSLDDDSFYLAILAENGYLDGVSEVIDPSAVISEAAYEELLAAAFAATAFSQEGAEALVSREEPENLAVSGEDIFLNAYDADRIVLGESGSLGLTTVTAQTLSITDADAKLDLDATEIERVLVNAGGGVDADGTDDAAADDADETVAEVMENTAADGTADGGTDDAAADDTEDVDRLYIHIDSESGLPEVILEQADDVVIEGSGSLGVIHVSGEVNSLTVRATGSVICLLMKTAIPSRRSLLRMIRRIIKP